MSKGPTHASVTQVPCTCNYLSNAADDPALPIKFDTRTGEYQFHHDGSILIIYHCPFCGGAAPESKRHLLFVVISPDEKSRLAELLAPLKSIAHAISQLGEPDYDQPAGTTVFQPEADGIPPRHEDFRTLRYEKLSSVADVAITERRDGSIHWILIGKYLGEPASGE